ncbi:MAG: YbaK/EbsC family protein [Chromatiales bacterium]|jgi:Ala-tRNA(Pro) deacylase
MALPPQVKSYIESKGVDYRLGSHDPTTDSLHTAQAAHIPGGRLVKAVLLEDDERYLLALIPASRRIHFSRLHALTGRQIGLATEPELGEIFPDCKLGAVPAVGQAYGLDILVDETLLGEPELWLEAGDHQSLVGVSGDGFRALIGDAQIGAISEHR